MLISRATGHEPYFLGKPNPLMMRSAMRAIDAHTEHTLMIGDRMDTDIVAGLEAGLRTVLVLSGISTADSVTRFPYAHTWWWTRSPIWSAAPTTRSAAEPPGGMRREGARAGRPVQGCAGLVQGRKKMQQPPPRS